MSRPKPAILIDRPCNAGKKVEAVLKTSAVYAVFYQGRPMTLRVSQVYVDWPGPRYPRACFGSPGHAFNLADRLNKDFKTTDFAVYRLTTGVQITESLED